MGTGSHLLGPTVISRLPAAETLIKGNFYSMQKGHCSCDPKKVHRSDLETLPEKLPLTSIICLPKPVSGVDRSSYCKIGEAEF